VNISELLGHVERVRPQVGSLIRTILEAGGAGGSIPLGVVDENGVPTLSLRTIGRAMEVLDDFSKTKDYGATVKSREIHAYYVVERAISEQRLSAWVLKPIQPGQPEPGSDARDVPSRIDGREDDS